MIRSIRTPDTQYIGGAKELNTCTWGNDTGPVTGKDDIGHVMAYAKFPTPDTAIFYMGATRIVNNGDTHVDFELNRNPFKVFTAGAARPDRSVGDLIVALEYSNGGSTPEVTVWQVQTVTACANGQTVTVKDITDTSGVHSATNFLALPDQGAGFGAIPAFEFAEASIDLSELGIKASCPGFSSGSVRTRSGGDVSSSQLKDRVDPFPIDLNNCGKLRIEKRDENGDLLGGASFHLDADPRPGHTGALNVTDGGANDPDGAANGVIEFDPAKPDTYTVTETAAPPNYTIDNPAGVTKILVSNGSVTFTFSDTPLPPDLKITKVADDETVNAGEPIGFTIQVTNDGPGIAKNVTLSDPLPVKPGISWHEDPDRNDCTITSNTLNCDFGNMGDGAHATVHVTSATTKASCGLYDNTATASASNNADVEASDSTTVNCADVSVTKTADAASVSAGEQIGFKVKITNAGVGTATGITFSDNLPSGTGISWSLVGSPADWSITGAVGAQVLNYIPTTLAGNTSSSEAHVVSNTTKDSCKAYPNSATVGSANDGGNTASATTTVNCADVSVTKTADAASVSAGEQIGFKVKITNAGVGTATGITFSDNLPSGTGISWSLVGSPADWSITGAVGAQVLNYIPTTLAGNTSSSEAHVVSNTTKDSCKAYPNSATVGSANDGGNTASATTTVNCADVSVTKTADAASVSAGEQIGFKVKITNAGVGTATGITFSDNLPSGTGISWSLVGSPADWSITGAVGAQVLNYIPTTLAGNTSSSEAHVVSNTTKDSCKAYPNSATVGSANDGGNTASATTTVNCADVSVTKTADAASVSAGEQIGFKVQITNAGVGTATGITFSDNLPSGTGISWSLVGSPADWSITGAVGAQVLNYIPTMLAGNTSSSEAHVVSNTTKDSGKAYPNSATVPARPMTAAISPWPRRPSTAPTSA